MSLTEMLAGHLQLFAPQAPAEAAQPCWAWKPLALAGPASQSAPTKAAWSFPKPRVEVWWQKSPASDLITSHFPARTICFQAPLYSNCNATLVCIKSSTRAAV